MDLRYLKLQHANKKKRQLKGNILTLLRTIKSRPTMVCQEYSNTDNFELQKPS